MNKMKLNKHISQKFNADLQELKNLLLEMGSLVEQQIGDAVKAIVDGDSELAEKVIKTEDDVDKREIDLDELCTGVLARRQPAASDLRMVLAVMKALRDLERMGDEAHKIAKMALALEKSGSLPSGYSEVRHIGDKVRKMTTQSLDAFARFDVDTALEVAQADAEVDREYKSAMREMVTYMMEDPRSISRALNVIWALRALERIGDHAGNICEHVIYLVRGLDVRHISVSEIERQLSESE